MITAFDRSLFLRTLGATGVLVGVAAGVVVLTDEPGSTFAMRLARLAAMIPGLSSLGGLAMLEQARLRGEIRAMAALGMAPWQAARGAAVAGWCLGIVAALLLAGGWADAASLFPVLPEFGVWQAVGTHLVDRAHGIQVSPDGAMTFIDPVESLLARRAPGRWEATLAVASLGCAAPWWSATPLRSGERWGGFAAAFVLAVTLFHARAAGILGAAWLALAGLPLLLQAARARHTRARQPRARQPRARRTFPGRKTSARGS